MAQVFRLVGHGVWLKHFVWWVMVWLGCLMWWVIGFGSSVVWFKYFMW